MIYKTQNSGLKGVPKWGVALNKGERALNLNGGVGDEFVIVKENDNIPEIIKDKTKQIKRTGKSLDLNWARLHGTKINYKEIDQNGNEVESGKSLISFRFHSDKKNAEKTVEECDKEFGGYHVRQFIYDGIDKNEQQLIDWALNTDQFATDGTTKIFGAQLVSGSRSMLHTKAAHSKNFAGDTSGFYEKSSDKNWFVKLWSWLKSLFRK